MRIESATEQDKRVFVGHDSTRRKLVDVVNQAIEPYRGSMHGDAADGTVEVEFPTLVQAVSFIHENQMTEWAVLRDDAANVLDRNATIRFSMMVFLARHLLLSLQMEDAAPLPVEPIGERYRAALEEVPGATVQHFAPDTMGDVREGFVLEVSLPNGYGVCVARNGLSYGGEALSLTRDGNLLNECDMPGGTDIPPWNDLRLGGVADAVRVAFQVAALPA